MSIHYPSGIVRHESQVSPVNPTAEEIEAARTAAGGWTRAQLAAWGVPWPPPKGWRRKLEKPA